MVLSTTRELLIEAFAGCTESDDKGTGIQNSLAFQQKINPMKKTLLFMMAIVIFAVHPAIGQWFGTTLNTGVTYRDGNVVIGGTALDGSYGTGERILQLKGTGTWLSMVSTGGGSFNLGFSSSYGTGLYSRSQPIKFWTSPTTSGGLAERMIINTTGTIGIGTRLTSNPNGYLLAVNGKIGAKEVQVENTSAAWADYVFDADYNLRSLEEVQAYINQHKHLPEIPSADEVKRDGHKLGEMDVLLLKKVEELTLYAIRLQREVNTLKDQLEKMKNE